MDSGHELRLELDPRLELEFRQRVGRLRIQFEQRLVQQVITIADALHRHRRYERTDLLGDNGGALLVVACLALDVVGIDLLIIFRPFEIILEEADHFAPLLPHPANLLFADQVDVAVLLAADVRDRHKRLAAGDTVEEKVRSSLAEDDVAGAENLGHVIDPAERQDADAVVLAETLEDTGETLDILERVLVDASVDDELDVLTEEKQSRQQASDRSRTEAAATDKDYRPVITDAKHSPAFRLVQLRVHLRTRPPASDQDLVRLDAVFDCLLYRLFIIDDVQVDTLGEGDRIAGPGIGHDGPEGERGAFFLTPQLQGVRKQEIGADD